MGCVRNDHAKAKNHEKKYVFLVETAVFLPKSALGIDEGWVRKQAPADGSRLVGKIFHRSLFFWRNIKCGLRSRFIGSFFNTLGLTKRMKAIVYARYGPPHVLEIKDVEKPVPKDNEVLVRVHATTVCAGDVRLRKANPLFLRLMYGLWRPKRTNILGMEFAGTIESIGRSVTGFGTGDQVFGSTGLKFGTYAEFTCLPEGPLLSRKPGKATFEEAAGVPFGGVSALFFLRKGGIRAGQNVLIYGASGSVGTFAVQLAKHFGAHVTGVCSTANLELVKSLGANVTVDYTKTDFSRAGPVYDIVFDTVGKSGFWRSLKSLKRGGAYVLAASGLLSPTLGRVLASITGAGNVIGGMARVKDGDLSFLKGLIEAGKIRTVIDRRYPMNEIVEAHRYVEAGHKKGIVVIIVEEKDRAI
jgi:NADPH:quinone reductase-like Zn-dependent oxidoreductase